MTSLYTNERGLYEFQATDVAKAYVKDSGMCAWETGTGKSHFAMCLAALLFEDDKIDNVLLLCEKNKVGEWVDDFRKFTGLVAEKHYSTNRMKRITESLPQVTISTYETAKADLITMVSVPGKRSKSMQPGPLLEIFRGKRVLVIGDEFTKVKNRGSANHKALAYAVKEFRKTPGTRVWGLTATPIERDYEDAYNQFRILTPWAMPLVGAFEATYVASRDPYGRPKYREALMPQFASLCQPYVLLRRKTDPELIDEFPKQVEESHHIEMGDDQRKFYAMLEEIGNPGEDDDEEEPVPGLWTVMRQVAGHPRALLYSSENPEGSRLAKILVEELGEEYIRGVPSAKTEWLIDYLKPLVQGQGAKAVVFTFFGQSVLRILAEELKKAKFTVFLNHGQMTAAQQDESRKGFRAHPTPAVFLTSDAGARGINLPEATYVVEYESALTYANRTQRINRIHRIDSTSPSVTCMTAFMDDTVEEWIGQGMIRRNAQSDVLLGDDDAGEGFMTAEERRAALRISKRRKR